MNKRTVLSIIIGILCFMNFFIPIFGGETTYFDLFMEALTNPKVEGDFKVLMLAPTTIILILAGLHIAEPRSEFVTRGLSAGAAILGFFLYLGIYVTMQAALTVAYGMGDAMIEIFFGGSNGRREVGMLESGVVPVLYPLLFLAYALVHRYMSYDTLELQYERVPDYDANAYVRPIEDYDESEFV